MEKNCADSVTALANPQTFKKHVICLGWLNLAFKKATSGMCPKYHSARRGHTDTAQSSANLFD